MNRLETKRNGIKTISGCENKLSEKVNWVISGIREILKVLNGDKIIGNVKIGVMIK